MPSDALPPPPQPIAQFGMRALLLFIATISIVFAISIAIGSPEFPAAAGVVGIAWWTWRFRVASRAPLVPSVIGMLTLIGTLAFARLNPGFFSFFAVAPLLLIGTLLMALGAIAFAICALLPDRPQPPNRDIAAFLATLVAWFLCIFGGFGALGAMHRATVNRRAAEDAIALQQLVDDTNRIVKKLGRPPTDQEELERELGRPLPTVYDGGYESPVHYQRVGKNAFYLQYELWATDDHIYESGNPTAGWVQKYY
jgi:hypothetical protein